MAELNPMQAACWLARQQPDGVAAHLYVELDGTAGDAEQLAQAVRKLYRRHPMLRLRVTHDGRAAITLTGPAHDLHVTDLRDADAETVAAHLDRQRQTRSHGRPALEQGVPVRFDLMLLPGGRQRLGIDMDMIAADPSCLPGLLDDLAADLDDPARDDTPIGPPPAAPAIDPAARAWWRDRLTGLPSPPPLPQPLPTSPPASDRLTAILPPQVDAALTTLARQGGVTLSTLMLALFQAVLAAETASPRHRLSVAMFHRDPAVQGIDRMVGDFANFTLLDACAGPQDTLAQIAHRTAADMAARLTYASVPGVALLRDLSRLHGRVETGPVVFTAGLDLPTGGLLTPRAAARLGRMVWAISQGPGVALDAQVARLPDGLMLNWDIRLDLVRRDWVAAALARYAKAARRLAADGALWHRPLADWLPAPVIRPLGALQRAYLLGQGDTLPLGGVAMQEARLYRGDLPVALLHDRIAALIAAHPALRCMIDPIAGTMRLSDHIAPPVTTTDLTALPRPMAEARLADLWHSLRNRPCDLDVGPPWHLHLVTLPHDGGDRLAVIARFDGLILDGAGIARVMESLIGGADPVPTSLPEAASPTAEVAQTDVAWWRGRLAGVNGAPTLPWTRPLDQVRAPRWRRTGIGLTADELTALKRLAARHGLFLNSLLTTAVLDALARFTDDLRLTVALPVAPPPTPDRLGTAASFIAVQHDATAGDFADRARGLQTQVAEGLSHLAGGGVALGRMLAGRCGAVPLPVVVTNGMGWAPTIGGAMQLTDGLTQTPQVALDIRLTRAPDGGLCVDMDHAEPALDAALVDAIAAMTRRGLGALARREDLTLTGADLAPPPPAIIAAPPAPDWLGQIARNLWTAPPDYPALWHQGKAHSFAALGARVRQAMAGLAACGLEAGAVLAICLPRGPDQVAITLAATLSGIVWVPIDASAPPNRRAQLIAACAADLVIASDPQADDPRASDPARLLAACPLAARLPDATTLARRSQSEGPCYRLFTSGTTGAPKCVVLSTVATGQVIGQTLAAWGIGPGDVMISVTPLHHDMAMFDLFGAMVAGVPLVLPAATEGRDALAWNRLVAQHGVSIWVSVPAILDMLLACRGGHDLSSLRLIAQGGDYIRPATIATLRSLCPAARLVSLGGPTETTIWSIWHELTSADTDPIPYGRPLAGIGQRVINPLAEDCPTGVTGRIHTTGGGLALGYLRGGALDQTDFVTLPDGHGGQCRAFRTGDLGRMRDDGVMIFAGRTAGYIKIRGVRVSLGDVETALTRAPGITAALVVDLPGAVDGTDLGALIVPAPGTAPDTATLRRLAHGLLPDSHVPTRFALADALPLSANGKPDRAAARTLLTASTLAGVPVAQVLTDCLAVLGHPGPAGADTPLLSLGLTPAKLRPLSDRLAASHGRRLPPARLARCPTPAAIAAALSEPETP